MNVTENHAEHRPPKSALAAAYAAVYLIWGSTYLAIRVGVETCPPFLMAGVRFLVAGTLLLAGAIILRAGKPRLADWRRGALTGVLMLTGGNGFVVWAEKRVASGAAALIIATTPLWFVLFDWIRPGGAPPSRRAVAGIALGFAGVTFLAFGRQDAGFAATPPGLGALVLASICWAAGSLRARRNHAAGQSPWIQTSVQMICGGVALMAVSAALGEFSGFRPASVSSASAVAIVYLVVLGSWVGYSAYAWLLRVEPPSRVSTYAYVNPVVAVLLGWGFGGEQPTPAAAVAGAFIVAGVICLLAPVTGTTAFRRLSSNPERT
jgi:drug/metabolite transporter (DMT)-like permease